jgi:hypothetical protein
LLLSKLNGSALGELDSEDVCFMDFCHDMHLPGVSEFEQTISTDPFTSALADIQNLAGDWAAYFRECEIGFSASESGSCSGNFGFGMLDINRPNLADRCQTRLMLGEFPSQNVNFGLPNVQIVP